MTYSGESQTDKNLSERLAQFDTLLARVGEIEAQIDHFKPHYIALTSGTKEPVKGRKYTTTRLTPIEARAVLARGNNVGLVAHQGSFCFIDIDLKDGQFGIPPDRIAELLDHFNTFTVRTKSGGIQLYFWNYDLPTQIETRTGVANPKLRYHGADCGEIRTETQYVVAPGSYVPVDYDAKGSLPTATGVYAVVRDVPIRKLSLEDFPDWLAPAATGTRPRGDRHTVATPRRWVPNQEIRTTGDIVSTTGESLKAIREANPEVDHLLSGPTHDVSADGSRSGDDFLLCIHLIKYGFTPDQIAAILFAYRPYEKLFKNPDYIGITIDNARRRVDPEEHITTGRKIFDDVADPIAGVDRLEVDALPPDIPDKPYILVRGSPRIGKTHWGVTILANRGSGIYVSHRHEIIKHALEIFERIAPTATAVWLVGKNMACTCPTGTRSCETCPKYPVNDYDQSGRIGISYSDTESYAHAALAQHRILTKERVADHYCPYYVLHLAKKMASYVFTIPYFLTVDDDLRQVDTSRYALTVIDEDPTITNFYPSGYEIATYKNIGRLSISAENLIATHIEAIGTKLETTIAGKQRKTKADKAILAMIQILRTIDDAVVTLKDTPNLQTKHALMDDLATLPLTNEWSPAFKKEVGHALATYERELTIRDSISVLALFEPLLYVAKNPFVWVGKNPGTLHFVADRVLTHPIASPQILIIGGTESRLFLNDISGGDPTQCATIEITSFKYAANYLLVRLDAQQVRAQAGLMKRAIRSLTTYNGHHAWKAPALILCSTIVEQATLAATHKSLAICSTNDSIADQKINHAVGRLNIFYQNSIISRGLDIPFYDLMFVDSCSFATPYWDAMQIYYRNQGDVPRAKECAAIKHSLLTDETTNSVVRHSPIAGTREDAVKIVVVKDRDYQHIWEVVRAGMREIVIDNDDDATRIIPRLADAFVQKVLPDTIPAIMDQLRLPPGAPHSARRGEATRIITDAGPCVPPATVPGIDEVMSRVDADRRSKGAQRGRGVVRVSAWYLKTVCTTGGISAGKRSSEKAIIKYVNGRVKKPISPGLQRQYLQEMVRRGYLTSEMDPDKNVRMYSQGRVMYTDGDGDGVHGGQSEVNSGSDSRIL